MHGDVFRPQRLSEYVSGRDWNCGLVGDHFRLPDDDPCRTNGGHYLPRPLFTELDALQLTQRHNFGGRLWRRDPMLRHLLQLARRRHGEHRSAPDSLVRNDEYGVGATDDSAVAHHRSYP